ncbi:glycosyltransferase [Bremerella alba]|uniref:glycosyltransferase n=1 Tax=Bremerella alba TaxID=980252 RepID=UPI001A95620C|nr:hypothetical protein [Bremerella alba]
MGRFRPIAERLLDAGHRVIMIVKDLKRAAVFLTDLDVRLFQAPVKISRAVPYNPTPSTFAHLLANMGYQESRELKAMLSAWRNLFDLLQPDLLLFDHSPTAMLAARGRQAFQMTIGTGFCCPVDEFPLPPMAPWRPMEAADRQHHELILVDRINSVLLSEKQPEIERIGQIYGDMDVNLLTTFAELDHYPQRTTGHYLGAWAGSTQQAKNKDAAAADPALDWPQGKKPKVFVYLKPAKAVTDLLRWISGQGLPAVVVGDGLNMKHLASVVAPNVQLHQGTLPMESVRGWCDIAILNGSHGTTCDLLLAGKPILQIPLTFEQALLTHRTVKMGVALDASPEQPRQAIQQLGTLLNNREFGERAQAFAKKLRWFNPVDAIDACVEQIIKGIESSPNSQSKSMVQF